MKILAIETSGKVCAVALLEDGKIIKEIILEDENTHSVKLMPLIEKILKDTKTDIQNVDLFACDIGPGSFTGIRIGVSTIKAFLDVTNKKAIGITSLETLAYNVEEDSKICSLIDAKNNNVYYGFFQKKADNYIQIGDLGFDNINNIINLAKNKKEKIVFVGNGSVQYKDIIKNQVQEAIFLENETINKLNAKNIAQIAYTKKDEAGDTNILVPIYLRPSSAERLQKNKDNN